MRACPQVATKSIVEDLSQRVERCLSSPRNRCRGEPSCGGSARRWRCRFSRRWSPRCRARARAAAKPVHRFQTFYVPNGMAMEYWSPKGEGQRLRALAHSGAAGAVPESDAGAVGPQSELELHSRRRVRIVSDGHDARRTKRGRRSSRTCRWTSCSRDNSPRRRRWHRSSSRWTAPANAGACTGILSCAYTHTHLVAQPDAAAADGVQPAGGVREAVWR